MKVRQLTIVQKEILVGVTYDGIQFFNPTLDIDGNWYISNEEVNSCTLLQALAIGCETWLTDLPEIDYNPIINNLQ